MKKLLSLLGFLLIIGLAGNASATPIAIANADFENGLVGWTATPETTTTLGTYGTANTAPSSYGGYYAVLEGTATIYQQNLNWLIGDSLTFEWNFLAGDFGDGYNDYAYYEIAGKRTYLAGVISSSAVELLNGGEGFISGNKSGWTSVEITFESYGSGDLLFGVTNVVPKNYAEDDDPTYNSTLLIDMDASPVPEPATMLLFGLGLLGIAGVGRRKA